MKETIEHMGISIQIVSDDDPLNPREDWDHPGSHMICWHSRYNLGDKHNYEDADHMFISLFYDCELTDEEVRLVLLGIVRDPDSLRDYKAEYFEWRDRYKDKAAFRYDFVKNWVNDTRNYLTKDQREKVGEVVNNHHVILPLYLYDHSGITMSTGRFSCPWDSGQVGFIYVSLKDAADNWRVAKEWDDLISYDNTTKTLRERTIDLLNGEVEEYDMYLTGDVWGYVVADGEDDEESCWGFFGQEYCIEEAKRVAEYVAKKRAEVEAHLATCSYEI